MPEAGGTKIHRPQSRREHCSLGTALLNFKGTAFRVLWNNQRVHWGGCFVVWH